VSSEFLLGSPVAYMSVSVSALKFKDHGVTECRPKETY